MKHTKKHSRKSLFSPALLVAFLLLSSCGLRNNPEPFSDGAKDSSASVSGTQADTGEHSGEEDHSPIPIAEFQYIKLDMEFYRFDTYAFNQEWLYFVNTTMEKENDDSYTYYTNVCQNKISGGSKFEEFISHEELNGLKLIALLADREGNCYTFGKRWGNEAEGIPPCFFMEKRSPEGVLKWRREYAPEELDGRGDQLNQGTIAQDGRICLYAQGAGGSIFVFDEEGVPEGMCTPALDSLDGIAAGAGGSVYGYCTAGDASSFVRLDNPEETYVCPMIPMQIFDGLEDGVYLSDKKSLWSYTPENAEIRKLWDWDDEYVQISAEPINAGTSREIVPLAGICRGEDSVTVLCMEQQLNDTQLQPFLTFASIAFRDRSEYPARKAVTLGLLSFNNTSSNHLRYLVRRYNRQSREYKVETLSFDTTSSLVTSIVRGDGPDLVETSLLSAGLMTAAATALEDLTDYYAASEKISPGDILPAVRDAGLIRDKNVLVIPAFHISCMRGMKELPAMEDWSVWSFLAMGQEKRMFQKQSPMDALFYCMGVRRGEHFIDYEKMECHFDSPDFRRILEECLAWEIHDGEDPNDSYPVIFDGKVIRHPLSLEEAPWLFSEGHFDNHWNHNLSYDKDCPRTYVGYPGWDGAEYELMANDVFAMTSSSQNKEGAWDFLEFLLSPGLQDDIDWGFPARADSLDAQLTETQNQDWRKDLRPSDEAVAYLWKILDSAVYNSDQNSIWFIISEEAQMYFAGDATLDATVNKIQNRVQNYLNELGG